VNAAYALSISLTGGAQPTTTSPSTCEIRIGASHVSVGAVRGAGYSCKPENVDRIAWALWNEPRFSHVHEAVERLEADLQARLKIEAEQVLDELRKVGIPLRCFRHAPRPPHGKMLMIMGLLPV
jgi:hypothetical protein